MKTKKVFILLGHPDKETRCGFFADAYEKGARDAGHEVRRTNIGEITFDPILHKGYKEIQDLEPDLKKVQEDIRWCEHFVVVYPTWWSAMPALLKGMFDRMWLPGFGYKFFKNGLGWTKLLKGRSASVIVTSDSHPFLIWLLMGDTTNEIRRGILWFSGFSPIRMHSIGMMKNISEARVERIKEKMYRLGQKAK